jgi:hypothetical protein
MSDSRALLLEARDSAIGLIGCFAECFSRTSVYL